MMLALAAIHQDMTTGIVQMSNVNISIVPTVEGRGPIAIPAHNAVECNAKLIITRLREEFGKGFLVDAGGIILFPDPQQRLKAGHYEYKLLSKPKGQTHSRLMLVQSDLCIATHYITGSGSPMLGITNSSLPMLISVVSPKDCHALGSFKLKTLSHLTSTLVTTVTCRPLAGNDA